MDNSYFHSVKLDKSACKGCVTCIKFCPTQAIRIRDGKALIIESRCIDCGECIRRCPNHAKSALTDSIENLGRFKFNVVLPAPALYAQFHQDISLEKIFAALIKLGFNAVYEVALAAEYVTMEIEHYIKNTPDLPRPTISSACPAVIRMIQVKFPALIKHIIPLSSPIEVAATEAKRLFSQKTGLPPEDIGVWFITPCPSKVTSIRQPVGVECTDISGAIGISSIYGELQRIIGSIEPVDIEFARASSYGIGWGYAGGEVRATGIVNSLIVHNVTEVVDVLEQVDMDKMDDVDYIECLACSGGCIGGPLTVEDRFVAEKNLKLRVRRMRDREDGDRQKTLAGQQEPMTSNWKARRLKIEPRPMMKLDDDIMVAMQKLVKIEQLIKDLPGLDCGACGSPTCASLAEDIVQGLASETDCIFKLRHMVNNLAEEMFKLSKQTPATKTKE